MECGFGAACAGAGASGAAVAAALQYFAVAQCFVNESWPRQADLFNGSQFDFIVVGGGAAGSVMAARLAELEGFSVLLLEAGGDPPRESVIPGFRDVLKGSEYDWKFTSANDSHSSQALIGGKQKHPRGKMLGGTGSINDMVYSRGFPADYEEWAETLGENWNWSTVLDYFKKTQYLTDERIINDPDLMAYHSRTGEMEVTGLNESTYTTDKFLEAFKEIGFDVVRDMTNPTKLGAGRFSHTIRRGHRESSATALLNKADGDLFVLKNTLVTKILIDDQDGAYGVDVLLNGQHFQFFSQCEVIISAGTFNTPKLLMLSGIGPKQHLKDLGIPVVRDLPVGENLHDHTMMLTYIVAESGTCVADSNEQYMGVIKYLYDRTGPLSKTNSMGALLSLNRTTSTTPDFGFYPTCIPKDVPFYEGCTYVLGFNEAICSKLGSSNKQLELITIAVVLLKPKSRGRVRLSSTNPLDEPLIYAGTFSNEDDLAGFPEAMEIAYSVANTTYFRGKGAHRVELNLKECEGLSENDALRCQAKSMGMSAWHAVGTAAMGSVVDSRLRVKGFKGLRVVDASVMPKIVRGNTFAPVVMMAEQAAEFIKKENEVKILARQ